MYIGKLRGSETREVRQCVFLPVITTLCLCRFHLCWLELAYSKHTIQYLSNNAPLLLSSSQGCFLQHVMGVTRLLELGSSWLIHLCLHSVLPGESHRLDLSSCKLKTSVEFNSGFLFRKDLESSVQP